MMWLVVLYTGLSLFWPYNQIAMPYREQTLLGIFLFSLVSIYHLFERNAVLGLAAFYFSLVCYLQATNPQLYIHGIAEINKAKLQFFAIESWLIIILVINAFLFGVAKKPDLTRMISGLFLFGVIVLTIQSAFGLLQSVWFFNPGGAQDAGFIGSLYPFYWSYYRNRSLYALAFGTLVYVAAIFLCGSAVGIGVLVCNLGFILLGYRAIVGILISPLAYYFLRSFFNDNGRLNIWSNFYSAWTSWGDVIWGTGPGSFQFLNIIRQQAAGERDLFMWAHNSWLQTMFEYGYMGLALMVGLFFILSFWLRNNRAEFVSLWLLAFYGLFQMPLNHMTSLALITYLFIIGYNATAKREKASDCN